MDEIDEAVIAGQMRGRTEPEGPTRTAGEPGQAAGQAHLDRLQLELSAWMDEYKSLRSEISQTLTSSRQMTQVAIIALAAQVGLAGYIVQNDLPILFLMAPLVFYGIAWTQLRLVHTSRSLGDYVLTHVSLGAIRTLEAVGPYDAPIRRRAGNRHLSKRLLPLQWDEMVRHEMHTNLRRLWFIEASAFVIPVFTAMLFPGAYLYYVSHFHTTISAAGRMLLLCNEIVFIYTVMIGLWMRRQHLPGRVGVRRNMVLYGNLFLFQLANFVCQVWWNVCGFISDCCSIALKRTDQPIARRSHVRTHRRKRRRDLPCYDRPVHFIALAAYRTMRILFWATVLTLTWVKVNKFNNYQKFYVKRYNVVFVLRNNPFSKITPGLGNTRRFAGLLMGYDGTKYVVMHNNERQEIDASLVADIIDKPHP